MMAENSYWGKTIFLLLLVQISFKYCNVIDKFLCH